jgi:fructosamine-3-kinase
MSAHESELSWTTLRAIARRWNGDRAELAEVRTLDGGHVSTTVQLTLKSGEQGVLKISPHRVDRSYEREAFQLELFRSVGVPVPRIYLQQTASLDSPDSFLLMEFIEGTDLAHAKKECSQEEFDGLQDQLAEIVSLLHDQTGTEWCRATPDHADASPSWASFYHSVYDPLVRDLEKNAAVPAKVRKHILKLHDRLDSLLAHDDRPRLLHWDLWSTNIRCRRNGAGKWSIAAILDPECKYAHFEAEIAYLDLFHTVNPAFYAAYGRHRQLGADYHNRRKPIYQLYPLVNHVCNFGEPYIKLLVAQAEKTMPLV